MPFDATPIVNRQSGSAIEFGGGLSASAGKWADVFAKVSYTTAIDGISLTIFSLHDCNFSVELIPHTLRSTTLGFKNVGDAVNIENDMLVKYVEKILTVKATSARAS